MSGARFYQRWHENDLRWIAHGIISDIAVLGDMHNTIVRQSVWLVMWNICDSLRRYVLWFRYKALFTRLYKSNQCQQQISPNFSRRNCSNPEIPRFLQNIEIFVFSQWCAVEGRWLSDESPNEKTPTQCNTNDRLSNYLFLVDDTCCLSHGAPLEVCFATVGAYDVMTANRNRKVLYISRKKTHRK